MKDAGERFQNALDFADALTNALGCVQRSASSEAQAARSEPTEVELTQNGYVAIRRNAWFQQFSPGEVNEMMNAGEMEACQDNAVIVREGDKGDAFYVLLKGTVRVTKNNQVIGTLDSGECFGEMALLSADVRTASIIAAEHVLL